MSTTSAEAYCHGATADARHSHIERLNSTSQAEARDMPSTCQQLL